MTKRLAHLTPGSSLSWIMSHILQTGCVNLLKPRPRPAEPFLHGLNAVCTLPQQTRHTLYRPLKTILRYGFNTFIYRVCDCTRVEVPGREPNSASSCSPGKPLTRKLYIYIQYTCVMLRMELQVVPRRKPKTHAARSPQMGGHLK